MSNVVVKNLNVRYEDKVIFDSFNIEFEEKKVNVILGSSGVGKTTILNSIPLTVATINVTIFPYTILNIIMTMYL